MICSKEATYPGHILIRFWSDSGAEGLLPIFCTLPDEVGKGGIGIALDVRPSVQARTRKLLLRLFPNICSMHTGPREFAWRFSVSSAKSKIAAKILCRSLELEPLHGFVLCLV